MALSHGSLAWQNFAEQVARTQDEGRRLKFSKVAEMKEQERWQKIPGV
jgi:hypothetical protein